MMPLSMIFIYQWFRVYQLKIRLMCSNQSTQYCMLEDISLQVLHLQMSGILYDTVIIFVEGH
jgi:hypothetical protein